MKKLSLISVAALMLASCSSDDLQGPAGAGTEQEVELTFQLPGDVTGRALTGSDSSKGGATNSSGDVTFTIAISYGDNVVFTGSQSTTLPNANASVTFRPTLVLGETYNLTAYAQFDGEVVELKSATTTAGLNGVTVTEAGGINDESVDAYFHQGTLVAQAQMGATLHRHTGKLRIIAEDFAAAEKQLGKTIEKVEVTYTKGQPTVFNIVNGTWDEANSLTAATASADVAEYSNESDSRTLMVDYIPAPKAEDGEIIVNISKVVVTFSDNTTFTKNLSQLDIPVKRNYLTTLRGNFFLQEMDLKIELDDTLDGELGEIDYELVSAFENGGLVTLSNDITLTEALVAKSGANVVIDLNGHTISGTKDIYNTGVLVAGEGSTITIKGDGTVSAIGSYPVKADKGTINIESGNFIGDHSTQAAYVSINGGTLNISGGYFAIDGKYYDDNGNEVVYTGGHKLTINSYDAAYASGIAKINITGGTFYKFDPSNNPEGEGTSYVADGYSVLAENDTYTVVKGESVTYVAEGVYKDDEENYCIHKAAGLTWFSDQLNNQKNQFKNETVKVVAPIDMNGVTYYGGSVENYPGDAFCGTFDGGKNEISNLTITVSDDVYGSAALIPTVGYADAVIKDVILTNVNISSSHYAAGIWGYMSNSGSLKVTNCQVNGGNITGVCYKNDTADKIGGIGGIFYVGEVSECSVSGVTITGYRDMAGIVGYCNDARASVINNAIEDVTINVDNTSNYKKYTSRSNYDVNDFAGEATSATVSGNTGTATINWGSIAE